MNNMSTELKERILENITIHQRNPITRLREVKRMLNDATKKYVEILDKDYNYWQEQVDSSHKEKCVDAEHNVERYLPLIENSKNTLIEASEWEAPSGFIYIKEQVVNQITYEIECYESFVKKAKNIINYPNTVDIDTFKKQQINKHRSYVKEFETELACALEELDDFNSKLITLGFKPISSVTLTQ